MAPTVLHLRSETKPLEHRSALTPTTAAALIKAGYAVNIERSPERIFDDAEFEAAGATLVPEGSWEDAPKEHIIIGLKELEEKTCRWQSNLKTYEHPANPFAVPLKHVHVQFAHCCMIHRYSLSCTPWILIWLHRQAAGWLGCGACPIPQGRRYAARPGVPG